MPKAKTKARTAPVTEDPLSSLPAPLRKLCQKAQEARKASYAPYSGFHVGAAVKTRDGRIFTAANVENASYGLSVCAERSAIIAAVLAGARELSVVAVCTDLSPPAPPCGMCRQSLAEFSKDCEVVLCGPPDTSIAPVRVGLNELLPTAFSPASLAAFAVQQRERSKESSRIARRVGKGKKARA